MYNSNNLVDRDLPSAVALIKATILAAISALIIFFLVVMPSEFGRDPTGVGRMLGLLEMGQIKQSLVLEAEQDAKVHQRELAVEPAPLIDPEAVLETEVSPRAAPHRHDHGHHHGDGNYHHH